MITTMTAINLIFDELEKAERKHPLFPTDPIHAVAIMEEESGETMRAALRVVYENGDIDELKKELIQAGAMAVRCLINLHNFKPAKSEQL
jgi:hypothetical protein